MTFGPQAGVDAAGLDLDRAKGDDKTVALGQFAEGDGNQG